MAVIQISRIQHRRGDRDQLPEALAEGEIGFATDSGEVFIGAPNLGKIQYRRLGAAKKEGIFPYSNIRLLTEFDVGSTLSDDVYWQGPLLRTQIPPSSLTTVTAKYNGVDATSYADFYNVFPTDQRGAIIDSIMYEGRSIPGVAGKVLDGRSNEIPGSGFRLDLRYVGLTPVQQDEEIQISYRPTIPVYEWLLQDADAMIIDYSMNSANGFPEKLVEGSYRRIGSVQVICDTKNVGVRDEFTEINTAIAGASGLHFSGRTIAAGDNTKVIITCVNMGLDTANLTFTGRRWTSKFKDF